jgi:hypothetical protein
MPLPPPERPPDSSESPSRPEFASCGTGDDADTCRLITFSGGSGSSTGDVLNLQRQALKVQDVFHLQAHEMGEEHQRRLVWERMVPSFGSPR